MARLDSFDVTGYGPTWFDVNNDVNGWWDRDLVPGPRGPVPPIPSPAGARVRFIPDPHPQGGASADARRTFSPYDGAIRDKRLRELFDDALHAPVVLWQPPPTSTGSGPSTWPGLPPKEPQAPEVIIVEVEKKIFVDRIVVEVVEVHVARAAEAETAPELGTAAPAAASARAGWPLPWLLMTAAAVVIAVAATVFVMGRGNRPPRRLPPKKKAKRRARKRPRRLR